MNPPVSSSGQGFLSFPASHSAASRRPHRVRNANVEDHDTASLWDRYVRLVQRHRTQLLAWESIVDRLLWLYPGQSNEGSAWRQILWSLAELQHLAIDLALQQDTGDGMTLDIGDNSSASLPWRIGLTVLHNLGPVLYDRIQQQHTETHPQPPTRRGAYWQYQLERLRVFCRLAILVPHYWNMYKAFPDVTPGILQRGGLVPSPPRPLAEVQARRRARRDYVGRRTGRRVLLHQQQKQVQQQRRGREGSPYATADNTVSSPMRMLVGELLYTFRPLFWAHAQYRHGGRDNDDRLWKSWLVSLGLDIASLACLRGDGADENRATAKEWKRRRLRLLLYLLRGPCGDRFSQPVADKAHEWLTYLPLLGNLLGAYLQDWLYYWRVYQLEE